MITRFLIASPGNSCPSGLRQSQRDCDLQPGVGELASLPWVGGLMGMNPEGVPPLTDTFGATSATIQKIPVA